MIARSDGSTGLGVPVHGSSDTSQCVELQTGRGIQFRYVCSWPTYTHVDLLIDANCHLLSCTGSIADASKLLGPQLQQIIPKLYRYQVRAESISQGSRIEVSLPVSVAF